MPDDELRLRAELDGALERDVQSAARAVDDLGEEAVETAAQLAIMEAAAKGAARGVDDLGDEARDTERHLERLRREQDKSKKSTDQQTSAYDRMERTLKKLQTRAKGMELGKVLGVVKIPAIIAAVGGLAAGVSALGAAGYAGVAGLAPLTAMIMTYPALLTTVLGGFAAVKLGVSGVGEALKALASGDSAKAQEALAKLHPQARAFAIELNALVQGPLKDLKRDVAGNLFPGLRRGLAQATPFLPVLREGLAGSATQMGRLGLATGRAMGSPFFQAQMGRIMGSNNRALYDAGRATGNLGRTLLNLLDAWRPVNEQMMTGFRSTTNYWQAASRAGVESGRLAAFFQRAWDLARGFGSATADLAVGLFHIGQESQVMSRYLGRGLSDSLERFREWSDSIEGRASVRAWFADAIPVMREFTGLIADIGRLFGNLATHSSVAPLISQMRAELMPALEGVVDAIATGWGPALITAATAFVHFQSVIAASPIPPILLALAAAVNGVLEVVLALPQPLKILIATLIAFNFAAKILTFTGGKLVGAFSPLGGLIKGMRQPVAATTTEFSRMERVGHTVASAVRNVGYEARIAGTGLSGMRKATAVAGGALSGLQRQGRAAMGGLRSAASGLTGFLGGPWGVAFMAATAIVGIFLKRHADAKARVEAYTGSLNEQTGAITKNTDAVIVNNLEKNGMLEKARKLGIASGDVVRAIKGEGDAYDRVRDKLLTYDNDVDKAMAGQKFFGITLSGNSRAAIDLASAIGQEAGALDEAQASTRRKADALRDLNGKTRAVIPNVNAAAAAEDKLSRGASRTSSNLRGQAAASGRLTQKTLELHNAFMKAQQGAIGYEQAIDDAAKEIRKGAKTMDIGTQAGRDNRLALMGVAQAAADIQNKAKRQEALEEARKKIAKWADEAGMGTKQAQRYADNLIRLADKADDLPKNANVNVTTSGISESEKRLLELQANITNLTSRSHTIDVRLNRIGGGIDGMGTDGPRRFGGPVGPSRNLVGEVGPELYLNMKKGIAEVIGKHGPETRTFRDPGYVLPNHVYEEAKRTDDQLPTAVLAKLAEARPPSAPPPAPAPQLSRRADFDGIEVGVHFHTPKPPTEAEAAAAGRAAAKAFFKETEDRQIHWKPEGES